MREALHILKKDLGQLWPQIGIVVMLSAIFCWLEASPGGALRQHVGIPLLTMALLKCS